MLLCASENVEWSLCRHRLIAFSDVAVLCVLGHRGRVECRIRSNLPFLRHLLIEFGDPLDQNVGCDACHLYLQRLVLSLEPTDLVEEPNAVSLTGEFCRLHDGPLHG